MCIYKVLDTGADMDHYTHGTLPDKDQPEEAHWLWSLVGMLLAMFMLAMVGAWIAEALA